MHMHTRLLLLHNARQRMCVCMMTIVAVVHSVGTGWNGNACGQLY
jgi:hypothetical protein